MLNKEDISSFFGGVTVNVFAMPHIWFEWVHSADIADFIRQAFLKISATIILGFLGGGAGLLVRDVYDLKIKPAVQRVLKSKK